ncbi:hypothetical protein, partial [uncultured Rhodoblastus sp.]|uniref:hypothetical protein n=1 Tax=uncultured Rhodoblastus sp. TaxID=543037 RepID=UPI0025E56BE4
NRRRQQKTGLPIKIAEVVHRNDRHGARINETILSYRPLFAKSDRLLGVIAGQSDESPRDTRAGSGNLDRTISGFSA